jgi:uncharacterized membrane protein
MDFLAKIAPFTATDAAAVALIGAMWLLTGWLTENPPASRPSVSLLMQGYRRDWMRAFVTRQPRIFDATLIDSLRQSTAFYASASMIAIGGGVALIGNSAAIASVAQGLTLPAEAAVLPLKMLLVIAFLANALLKFVWAHRLFGYCSILMGAVPNDPAEADAFHRAEQAAEINIYAAKSFNRGLRSIYFALAALGWLVGPYGLIVATAAAGGVLLRREFASQSRAVMLKRLPD